MTFPYNVSKTPAFSTDPYHPLFAPWCCLRVRAGWEILGKFSFSFFLFFFFPLENARSQTPAFPQKRCFGEIFIRKS